VQKVYKMEKEFFNNVVDVYKDAIRKEAEKISEPRTLEKYLSELDEDYEDICNFIFYYNREWEIKENNTNLPMIHKNFLQFLKHILTYVDEVKVNSFMFSPENINKMRRRKEEFIWAKDIINDYVLKHSWNNFKLVQIWYKKLISMGYKVDLEEQAARLKEKLKRLHRDEIKTKLELLEYHNTSKLSTTTQYQEGLAVIKNKLLQIEIEIIRLDYL